MPKQYGRNYELIIKTESGYSKVIKGLRVNFEITKSVLGFPNICKLIIYNPNDETLSMTQEKYTSIIFKAGYGDKVDLLFKGQIKNVFQSSTNVDKLITIFAGDGERDWQNATFNKTFTENVTVSAAIKDVISSFKEVTVGTIEGLPEVADKLRGQSLSGSSKDILDQFAKEYSFNWSIQDEEIVIVPKTEVLQGDEAVLINNRTGMIGSPTLTEVGADVTTLLNSNLMPNKAFQITSTDSDVQIGNLNFRKLKRTSAEGTYKIQEVIFKGDSREGSFLSSVKGISINV
jgi:hypothetical protein